MMKNAQMTRTLAALLLLSAGCAAQTTTHRDTTNTPSCEGFKGRGDCYINAGNNVPSDNISVVSNPQAWAEVKSSTGDMDDAGERTITIGLTAGVLCTLTTPQVNPYNGNPKSFTITCIRPALPKETKDATK